MADDKYNYLKKIVHRIKSSYRCSASEYEIYKEVTEIAKECPELTVGEIISKFLGF